MIAALLEATEITHWRGRTVHFTTCVCAARSVMRLSLWAAVRLGEALHNAAPFGLNSARQLGDLASAPGLSRLIKYGGEISTLDQPIWSGCGRTATASSETGEQLQLMVDNEGAAAGAGKASWPGDGDRSSEPGDAELHALHEAAGQVFTATGRAAGALRSWLADDGARASQQCIDDANSAYDDEVAVVRRRVARSTTKGMHRITAAVSELAPDDFGTRWVTSGPLPDVTDPLAAARYVRLGTLDVPDIDMSAEIPLIVPLLDEGNVVLRSGQDVPPLKGVIHNIVVRALAGTGPGQLMLRVFDPCLRGYLAPFMPLREVSDELFASSGALPENLEELLDQLVDDVRRVGDLGRGQASSLGALRRATGQPLESYQLVTLLDFPQGVSERSARTLVSLLRSGPAHGISFVIHHNSSSKNAVMLGEVLDQLDRYAQTVTVNWGAGTVKWSGAPHAMARLEVPTGQQLQSTISVIATRARSATAPRISFAEIQSTEQLWTEKSADGITAAVGRVGHDVVSLTLGDDREQRHNVLVTGAVGQGKSNFLKVFIHSLAVRYGPDELELCLLDFKDGVTFYPLAPSDTSPDWLPHVRLIGLESDRDYGIAVLEYLFAEFDRRARVIKPHGDQIATYRRQVPDAKMPRIVAVIDEFQVLFEEDDPLTDRAVQLLERLARRGRAYGIHLVLASQTISGITALMAKEGGIYSQFPIRVALKNSSSESQAVLDTKNTEAARLRFRGEAVVNLDFGQIEGNRRAVIAVAEDDDLTALRMQCWNQRPAGAAPPSVFLGSSTATLVGAIPQLRELRASTRATTATKTGLLGMPIAITDSPIGVPLPATPGRHLAVVGAGHRAQPLGIGHRTEPNLAIGALQAAAISLAIQHPTGDASFTVLSYLTDSESADSGMPLLLDLLHHFSCQARLLQHQDATAELPRIAQDSAHSTGSAHYVVAFALDRAGALNQPDESFNQPVEDLQAILRDGPAHGTHILGWWSSIGMFKAHLGYDPTTAMDSILALRAEQRDITDLMGHTVTWSPRDNRGLLFDRTQLPAPVTLIPLMPLNRDIYNALTETDWDQ
ncbi:hypothetical protein CFP75_23000 [Amycolatopsis alba DSM 44262]|uniref:FtsK domain-containing protein n=2 Tax=Amycolatopsis alba TaxID=76020 RepID=A0A229RND9_AMYAL|nr:hypothetical protein CFP75_23000 [Amycolatopsis alba DSM 44262]